MPVLCLFAPDHLRSTGFGLLNFAGVFAGGVMATLAGYLKSSLGLGLLVQASGLAVLLASAAMLAAARQLQSLPRVTTPVH
jgi:hypothetical protein